MATYTISPQPYETVFDDNGAIVAGALIYTYAAGGSTPVDTFSDSIGTKNSNPIQADGAGRFVAFLETGHSYKFTYKTAAGVLIKTVDGIAATGTTSVQASDIGTCHGRLTLTTGTPVTISDVLAAVTLYYTPYAGNQIALYDGVTWSIYTFSELSLSLALATADKNYDVFAYASSGAVAIESLVWTSNTARATSLTTQDGVLVKSGDATRRYLGTYRTTGTIGQCEDSAKKRFVWNYYQRVDRSMQAALETADTWNYTTATIRQANNNTANQLNFVIGVAEEKVEAVAVGNALNSTGGTISLTAIGFDVTNAFALGSVPAIANTVTGYYTSSVASAKLTPVAGYHFLAWLEYSQAGTGTTTWAGDNGTATLIQSGIIGSLRG